MYCPSAAYATPEHCDRRTGEGGRSRLRPVSHTPVWLPQRHQRYVLGHKNRDVSCQEQSTTFYTQMPACSMGRDTSRAWTDTFETGQCGLFPHRPPIECSSVHANANTVTPLPPWIHTTNKSPANISPSGSNNFDLLTSDMSAAALLPTASPPARQGDPTPLPAHGLVRGPPRAPPTPRDLRPQPGTRSRTTQLLWFSSRCNLIRRHQNSSC